MQAVIRFIFSQCCCFCILAWVSQGHRDALRTESVQPSSMLGKTAGDSKGMCELQRACLHRMDCTPCTAYVI